MKVMDSLECRRAATATERLLRYFIMFGCYGAAHASTSANRDQYWQNAAPCFKIPT